MAVKEKPEETKYTRFIRDYGKPTDSLHLAMDFIKYSKGEKSDAKPIYKALIDYPRYERLFNNEKQGLYDIMRGKPVVNFPYFNSVIHFFCGGTDKNYGKFDYNRDTGILRYILKPYDQHYKKANGGWGTREGVKQQVMSQMKSPKGLYTPEHGNHPAYKIFGNEFNTIFNPDIMLYKDRTNPNKIIQTKGSLEIPSIQIPAKGNDDNGKIRYIQYLLSQFILNAFKTPEQYAIFIAFLLYEKQTGYNGYLTWYKYAINGHTAWQSIFKKEAMSLIDAHEKEYQEKQFNKQFQQQWNSRPTTNQQEIRRDPQPDNRQTRKDFLTPEQWDELYNESKQAHMNKIQLTESQFKQLIKESIHQIILEYEREWTDDSDPLYWEFLQQYSEVYIYQQFKTNPKSNSMWYPLINPYEYKQALTEYMKFGEITKFPTRKIYQWMGLCLKNIALLRSTTAIYGHTQWCDVDVFVDNFFDGDYEEFKQYCQEHDEDADWSGMSVWFDENGFYDWSDSGTDTPPYSDYGLEPLEKLASEYTENMSPEQCLVLLNKILDVVHCRGDLSALFVKGGKNALYNVSNH